MKCNYQSGAIILDVVLAHTNILDLAPDALGEVE